MAHFAEVRSDNNEVLRAIVITNKDVDAHGGDYSQGAEDYVNNLMANAQSESIKELFGGSYPSTTYWKQCSYNKKRRGCFPGPGCTYNVELDRFEGPKYFDSWILNEETCQYEAPIPRPSSIHGNYFLSTSWDEPNQRWVGAGIDGNPNTYVWNTETNVWEEQV